uniref:Uncharacterized protein n=1 Tax=uncultured marine thaumarchaeote KM3_13_H10 TaxID=1456008 RepID=A0A075GG96_9ARCH|nr:hypothetical protein [uncultured marine thaumarchaeote KM3_13_H10]
MSMIGFLLFLERSFPISPVTVFIIDKSISPFFFCGVPTVTKIKSQSLIVDNLFVTINFLFKAFFNVFSKFGSKNVGMPSAIFEHFLISESIPIVLIPLEAKTEHSESPTNPKPIIAIFISDTNYFTLKIMLFYTN